ncbi:MAG: hypothetical protein DMF61_13180 [Blastocatellia bacterium AA13]|nr:MAG: hypothetical protein DMF61_13180 [Blastocatellia bacterium AA13]
MQFNILRLFLSFGVALCSVLLLRFAWDLTARTSLLLGGPFWVLVLASLAIAATNLIGVRRNTEGGSVGRGYRIFFLAAIPLGFFASSLDCTGLSLSGCTPFCTFVKSGWAPAIGLVAAAYYWFARPALLALIALMSLIPIAPHCLCYNPANAWWINAIGRSPECYSWGLMVSVIAISSLRWNRNPFASMTICLMVIGGSTAFFVGHHYFGIPW